ncbi:MAG: PspA/IM30 family protein [Pseudomonadota bacterium]
MLRTIRTLVIGANARAEEQVRDTFSIELIDQKIREAQGSLKAAKLTLANLVQRQRIETRHLGTLNDRIADLETRAQAALDDDNEDRARQAAAAIAEMENEQTIRDATVRRLDEQIARLEGSVEAGHRRIIDLKQGAIQARAVRSERNIQGRLNRNLAGTNAAAEAQELIQGVLNGRDPFEEAAILDEIEGKLDGSNLADRMAAEGYGAARKSTEDAVLERLKSKK